MTWQVRYTWQSLNGVPHPRFTYGDALTEDKATNQAEAAIARHRNDPYLRLVEVHTRPVSSSDWTAVEQPAPVESRAGE